MKSAIVASALAWTAAGDPWGQYKKAFEKEYNSQDEEKQHRLAFQKNQQHIHQTNARQTNFQLALNQFSDLSQDMFRIQAGLGHIPLKANEFPAVIGPHVFQGEDLQDSVDWVEKGAVTGVKNQGQCGSCWSFGTTGGIEGAWKISTGILTSLSEQQLVDCSTRNLGCQGGNAAWAINYETKVALATEGSYPYKATQGECQTSFTTAIPEGGVTGYRSVGKSFAIFSLPATVPDLMSAIQDQPVSIAIEADQQYFQLYKSGVLTEGCGQQLDHAVLAVGYGTENENDYWYVKNSWGTSWGLDGFIKIGRGADNLCGVLSQPLYPVVSSSVTV